MLSVLLEAGSLTRAARILGTTQPAVSKILSRLRAYFSDPLFVRVGLAMHPTPKALDLVEPLHDLLATSGVLRSVRPFDPARSRREFVIIATDVGMTQFVPPLIRHLETSGPGLRLRALPLDVAQFEHRLESGDADVAIGAFAGATAGMRRQSLYADSYLSVARRDHPRLRALRKAAGFFDERHVLVTASNTGHGAHHLLEQALSSRLAPEHAHVRVGSFLAGAFVAARTDAIATMPARLAANLAKDLKLAAFKPALELPAIEISQFWHQRVDRDPSHVWLRNTIFRLFGRAATP